LLKRQHVESSEQRRNSARRLHDKGQHDGWQFHCNSAGERDGYKIAPRTVEKMAAALEDFARKAGLHRVGYGWIEQRKRIPNLAALAMVAADFDISLSDLFSALDHPRKQRVLRK
jgi:transcriptional regulator with XRE-family HTH domain